MEFLKLENRTHILLVVICIIISIYYVFSSEFQRYYEKIAYYIKYNVKLGLLRLYEGGQY
mgnify:CR=1 FL=1